MADVQLGKRSINILKGTADKDINIFMLPRRLPQINLTQNGNRITITVNCCNLKVVGPFIRAINNRTDNSPCKITRR